MKTIKKIDAWSAAKLTLVLNALFGVVLGFLVMGMSFVLPTEESRAMPWFMVIGAPVVFPIFYALVGLVFGYVMALFYNLAAKWVGGIKVEIQD